MPIDKRPLTSLIRERPLEDPFAWTDDFSSPVSVRMRIANRQRNIKDAIQLSQQEKISFYAALNQLEVSRNIDAPFEIYLKGLKDNRFGSIQFAPAHNPARTKPPRELSFLESLRIIDKGYSSGWESIWRSPGTILQMYGESELAHRIRQKAYGTAQSITGIDIEKSPAIRYFEDKARQVKNKLLKAGLAYQGFITRFKDPLNYYTPEELEILNAPFKQYWATQTFHAVGSSTPQMGISLIASMLTGNPTVGLTMLGISSSTQAYQQFRSEGIDPDMALVGSVLIGSIEVLTEKVPIEMLIKGKQEFLTKALLFPASESLQELLAQLGQNYVQERVRQAKPGQEIDILRIAKMEWSIITEGWQQSMAAGAAMGMGFAGLARDGNTHPTDIDERGRRSAQDVYDIIVRIRKEVREIEKTQQQQQQKQQEKGSISQAAIPQKPQAVVQKEEEIPAIKPDVDNILNQANIQQKASEMHQPAASEGAATTTPSSDVLTQQQHPSFSSAETGTATGPAVPVSIPETKKIELPGIDWNKKKIYTSTPSEWFTLSKLVDYGNRGLRVPASDNRRFPGRSGRKIKYFDRADEFAKVPVRLADKEVMKFIRERTDEVLFVEKRYGENYYLVPNNIIPLVESVFGQGWNKQAPKKPQTPKQQLNSTILSLRYRMRKKDPFAPKDDAELGAAIVENALMLDIPLNEIKGEKTNAYINAYQEALRRGEIENVFETFEKMKEEDARWREEQEELRAEREAIQTEETAPEVGSFMEGLLEEVEPIKPMPEEGETAQPEIKAAKKAKKPKTAASQAKKKLREYLSPEKQKKLAEMEKQFFSSISGKLNMGMDVNDFVLGTKIMLMYAEAGILKFAEMAELMLDKGHLSIHELRTLYAGLRKNRPDLALQTEEEIDAQIKTDPTGQDFIVGTGPIRTRGLSRSIAGRMMASDLEETIGQLPEYSQMSWQEQIDLAEQYYNQDPERAIRFALYNEEQFPGLLNESMMTFLVNLGVKTGDNALLWRLATNERTAAIETEYGRRIVMLRNRNPILRDIREIDAARRNQAVRKGINVEALDKKVQEAQSRLDELERNIAEKEKKLKRKPIQRKWVSEADYREALLIFNKNKKSLSQFLSEEAGTAPSGEVLQALYKIGMYHLETVGRNLEAWTELIVKDVGEEIRSLLPEIWNKLTKNINDEKRKNVIEKMQKILDEDPLDIRKKSLAVNKLAAMIISDKGMLNREELIDRIVEEGKSILPGLNRRTAMELFRFYGQITPLDPNPIKAHLRELRTQIGKVLIQEDLEANIAPAATGRERHPISDETRRLMQLIEEEKRKHPDPAKSVKRQKYLRSMLDELHRRLENRIKDLKYEIKTRKKIIRNKTEYKYDERAKQLYEEIKKLEKQRREIFGDPKLTDEQRVRRAERAAAKSIERYEKQLAELRKGKIPEEPEQRRVFSAQLNYLQTERDILKLERDLLLDALTPKPSEEERALAKQKKRLRTEARRFSQLVADRHFEFSVQRVELDEEGKELKRQRDSIFDVLKTLKKTAQRVTTEEINRLMELRKSADEALLKLMTHPDKRRSDVFSSQATYEEMEWGLKETLYELEKQRLINEAQRIELKDILLALKKNPLSALAMSFEGFLQIMGFQRIIKTVWDNSWHLRQGGRTLLEGLTTPLRLKYKDGKFAGIGLNRELEIWLNTFLTSWKAGWNAARGDQTMMLNLLATIRSDPLYNLLKDMGVDLWVVEEELPVEWPERIPYFGRAIKTGSSMYRWSALYMRYQLAKFYLEIAHEVGQEIDPDSKEGLITLKGIGKLVNAQTGRGSMPVQTSPHGFLNVMLFSPRLAKATLDFMTSHIFDKEIASNSWLLRRAIYNNLRTIGAMALLLFLAKLFDDDSVTFDPKDADFGKIRIGNTRFDVTMGEGVFVVLASRIMQNASVSSTTKEVYALNPDNGFGTSSWDLITRAFRNKMAPGPALILDILDRHIDQDRKVTLKNILYSFATPIQLENALEAMDIEDRADLFTIMMIEFLGGQVQTYEDKKNAAGAKETRFERIRRQQENAAKRKKVS